MSAGESNMVIRKATPADIPALTGFVAMAESEVLVHFAGTTDMDKALAMLRGFIEDPVPNRYSPQFHLVAEVDGVAAGSVVCFPADRQPELDTVILKALNAMGRKLDRLFFEGEPGTFYLSTMGVDPAFRGRGVGSALMAAAEAEGASQGFGRASLLVADEKPRVKGLYERVGYRVAGRARMVGVGYLRMVKDLSALRS